MPLGSRESEKHKQKPNMFAFIFQITTDAGTNEHSESRWYLVVGDVKIGAAVRRTKGKYVSAVICLRDN